MFSFAVKLALGKKLASKELTKKSMKCEKVSPLCVQKQYLW